MNNFFKSILLFWVASFSANGQTPASWLERAETDVVRGDYQAANSEAELVRNRVSSGTSDPSQIRPVVLRIAEIKLLAGKFGEAEEVVHNFQAHFTPLTPLESVRTQIILAVSQAETGNPTGAQVAAQGAAEAAKGSGVDDVWRANARAELADVLLQEGRLFEARELAALVQTAARQNLNSSGLSARALSVYAEVALADGRADDARTWVDTVRGARNRESADPEAMMLREIQRRVDLAEGSPLENPDPMYSTIVLAKKELGSAHPFVARCLLTLARAEIRRGRWLEAGDTLASAGALLDVPNTRADLRLEWIMSSAELFVQLHRDNDSNLMLTRAKALASQYGLEVPLIWAGKAIEAPPQPASPKKDAAVLVARADQMLTAKDYAGAFPLYRQAADLGSASAMNTIGFLYEIGRGVTRDYGQAMQWYRNAADLGSSGAMTHIGLLYENGRGAAQDYAQAMKWFRKAAELGGSPDSQTFERGTAMKQIGLLYEEGHGVPQDYGQAMQWYRKAADLRNSQAMNNIGVLHAKGLGVPQDYAQAMQWYRKAADLGNSQAVINVGFLYEKGHGVEQDYTQAMQWYRKAADLGSLPAMTNIGVLYEHGFGVARDYGQAMLWYRKAADLGNTGAMIDIGFLYENGHGVPQDYGQAMQWYRKAADLGNPQAMVNVGFLYTAGRGVAQDYGQAMEWFRKAADLGNPQAIVNIAFFYQDGSGVQQDYGQAMEWFRKAADLGIAGAMTNVGLLYDAGRDDAGHGMAQDYEQAMQWYHKAADLGDARAMNNIGEHYQSGHGVPQDRSEAISWYRKAAALGNRNAKDSLKRLGDDAAGK